MPSVAMGTMRGRVKNIFRIDFGIGLFGVGFGVGSMVGLYGIGSHTGCRVGLGLLGFPVKILALWLWGRGLRLGIQGSGFRFGVGFEV